MSAPVNAADQGERDDFEEWAIGPDGPWTPRALKQRVGDEYGIPELNIQWDCWKASAARRPAAQGQALTGWQPIKTAPKDMVACLYLVDRFCVQGFVDATGELMVQSEVSPHWRKMRGKPSHWQPLPPPPEARITGQQPQGADDAD